MELIQFFQQNFAAYLLVFARISGIFITAPIFNNSALPARFKVIFSFFVALLVMPLLVQNQVFTIPNALLPYFFDAFVEVLIGLCLGIIMNIFFATIQVAGQMIDTQVGFGIVNVLDPQTGTQIPLIGNFVQLIFILVFLATDMHHLFLNAVIDSFDIVKLNQAVLQPSMGLFVLQLIVDMFEMAFKIAAPLIMATVLIDVSMGMLARTMPQLNVFVLGIPLKLAVGIFMLSIFLPTYIYILKVACRDLFSNIYKMLTLFGGG